MEWSLDLALGPAQEEEFVLMHCDNVEAAGFVFDGETTAVANPADDHTLNVFDEAIRGKTDQFVYRFRKPR